MESARAAPAAPAVTVVMPMRNARGFVHESLRSVLSEKAVSIEIVVVDDGSTDGSAEIVQGVGDPRIRLLDGPRQGIAACLNRGYAAARGDVLMRCDADDLYPSARIAKQVAWLRANPSYGAVCGGYSMVSAKLRPVASFGLDALTDPDADVHGELRRGHLRTHLCTFAWKRELFEPAGMFREYFETAEDLDFQMRLGERCQIRFLAGCAYLYRLHDDSITHTQGSTRRIFFEQTARRFQAQREVSGFDALQRGLPPAAPFDSLDAPTRTAEQVQGMLIGRAWWELSNGRRLAALHASLLAIRASPRRWDAWVTLCKVVLRMAGGLRGA